MIVLVHMFVPTILSSSTFGKWKYRHLAARRSISPWWFWWILGRYHCSTELHIQSNTRWCRPDGVLEKGQPFSCLWWQVFLHRGPAGSVESYHSSLHSRGVRLVQLCWSECLLYSNWWFSTSCSGWVELLCFVCSFLLQWNSVWARLIIKLKSSIAETQSEVYAMRKICSITQCNIWQTKVLNNRVTLWTGCKHCHMSIEHVWQCILFSGAHPFSQIYSSTAANSSTSITAGGQWEYSGAGLSSNRQSNSSDYLDKGTCIISCSSRAHW